MKLSDILESVLAFPQEKRKRQVMMDKLRKKSSFYDDITGEPTDEHPDYAEPKEFWLVNDDGKAVAVFDTEKEARSKRPEIEMKYGVRGLNIVPMN